MAAKTAFTLVELLVASTIALTAMAGVAALFAAYGRTVSQSQRLVELNAGIRAAASQLRQDVIGFTAPPNPWVRPEANVGYIQIVEGVGTDSTPVGTLGDVDDQLMGTTTAFGKPFMGSLEGTTGLEGFESPYAEVVWFCMPSGQSFEGKPLYNLHRRQLLVSATPGAGKFSSGVSASIDRNLTDLSCRNQGSSQVANSLGDLSKPANRFRSVSGAETSLTAEPMTLKADRSGEDVILTNVVAFDVRTYLTTSTAYADQAFNTNYADNTTPTTGASLRGLEARIRCVEPTTRQVRQVTVVHTFEGL